MCAISCKINAAFVHKQEVYAARRHERSLGTQKEQGFAWVYFTCVLPRQIAVIGRLIPDKLAQGF